MLSPWKIIASNNQFNWWPPCNCTIGMYKKCWHTTFQRRTFTITAHSLALTLHHKYHDEISYECQFMEASSQIDMWRERKIFQESDEQIHSHLNAFAFLWLCWQLTRSWKERNLRCQLECPDNCNIFIYGLATHKPWGYCFKESKKIFDFGKS